MDGVVGEETGQVAWCLWEPLADVGWVSVLECGGCGEAISGMEVEAVAEFGDALEFDAAGANLSALKVVEGCVVDDDVGLGEIEERGGDEAVPGAWLDLYAALKLSAIGWFGLGVGLIGAVVDGCCGVGKEAGGVGEVGCDAHIGEVGDAGAASEAIVGLTAAGGGCEEVFDVVDSEVLTAAQGEDQVVFVLDLVLSVEAVLLKE